MYIKRDLEQKIKKYLDKPEIIAIIGARQTGKTTLLRHIQNELNDSNYITFDDIEIRALFEKDIKSFIQLYIKPHRYIFIDEFQYAESGGQTLKYIYDTIPEKKIFISGSSILDITVKSVKYLSGRIFSFTLFPLSFKEYLSYKDNNLLNLLENQKDRILDEIIVNKCNTLLDDFIVYGGYPRIVTSEDNTEKAEVLKNIINIFLLRDIRDIIGLIDDYRMYGLLKALSLQIGNIISYQELSSTLKINSSTLKNYLNLLEKTNIIRLVKPFFTNKRTELVKNPKVYLYDTGLRNAIIGDFKPLSSRTDRGALLENFIFSQLFKSEHEIKYWRTKSKAEVDFIVDDKIPVEVKSAVSGTAAGKSLISFIDKYKPEKGFVYNSNIRNEIKISSTSVSFDYHFSVFE